MVRLLVVWVHFPALSGEQRVKVALNCLLGEEAGAKANETFKDVFIPLSMCRKTLNTHTHTHTSKQLDDIFLALAKYLILNACV